MRKLRLMITKLRASERARTQPPLTSRKGMLVTALSAPAGCEWIREWLLFVDPLLLLFKQEETHEPQLTPDCSEVYSPACMLFSPGFFLCLFSESWSAYGLFSMTFNLEATAGPRIALLWVLPFIGNVGKNLQMEVILLKLVLWSNFDFIGTYNFLF